MGVRDRYVRLPNEGEGQRSVFEGFLRLTRRFEPELWTVLLVLLILDVLLTVYGVRIGLAEGNPIARLALDRFGTLGLLALKGISLGIAFTGWALVDSRFRALVPLGISVVWAFAVAVNALLIVAVV